MKRRRNTYLLFAVVVSIWGIIGYKIIKTLHPDKRVIPTGEHPVDFRPKALQKRDTFAISVHQRDPFLGTFNMPKTKRVTVRNPRPVSKKEEAPEIPITFSGMITDNTSKEKIFFVSINNQHYVMKPQDEIQQVRLIKGNKNAIHVRYNNQLKTIPIGQ
ncbi:MAG: hypothetical protein AAF934_06540 [Bacteroidota bacterium]